MSLSALRQEPAAEAGECSPVQPPVALRLQRLLGAVVSLAHVLELVDQARADDGARGQGRREAANDHGCVMESSKI